MGTMYQMDTMRSIFPGEFMDLSSTCVIHETLDGFVWKKNTISILYLKSHG